MNKNICVAAVAAALCVTSLSTPAKVIQGVIKNASGEPMKRVEVKVRGELVSAVTNENGEFSLDLPLGIHILDVEGGSKAHFHQQVEVNEGNNELVELTLEDEPTHKIVVTANPLEHTSLDMATPTIVMSGEELVMKRATTLGEILQSQPGLSLSSFGPAVARPVIRGLGGARVQITNNQMIVQDASTTSADHDVGVEPLLAEQIEVVKGPATLLYGSGAIGGIVNTSDRKINDDLVTELTGGIEVRAGDSATGEESLVFTLDGGNENWNWHLDGYSNESDEIEIPGPAESEALHEAEQGEEESGHEEEAGGVLEGSQSETRGGSFGLTRVGEWGYVGASVSKVDKLYGVPGHAEHEEEPVNVVIEEAAHEGVEIDMSQTRYDLQASFVELSDIVDQWFIGYALTDYEHSELEGEETGTRFENEAWELKSYLKHNSLMGWTGIVGLQVTERDFVAIGEEAFVPPSTTQTRALFWVEERESGDLKWELGARFDSQKVDAFGMPEVSESGLSFSSGVVYSISNHNKLAFNFSKASRFASVEELFSFGPHVATRSFEIGNANLDKETSNNLDLSYRFESEKFSGEFNLFWNQFNDFIYGANVTAIDSCVSEEAATEAEAEDLQLVCYQQQDADFSGAEFQLEYQLGEIGEHSFKLGILADYIKAELDDGSYVPRIPPMKSGVSLHHDYRAFSAELNWTHFDTQDRLAENELVTEGFELLDLELAYRMPLRADEVFIFFKGKNLLDEEARDHSSFLKDLAPRPGRSFTIGARYSF
ncbi:TonB-dependent receptor [Aliikangiella sp. G2MR2-5]|uniref:TonB-dependent receptor n=1 Tax=Aliikangiella sp. G2MR2-5 TaxID=2788943 RepID=UPI0018AC7E2C|nr:TonB-dependent receptor [Aliikangiella sp. G2MR2-5]